MLKISLALAAALTVGTAFVTTAEARGCHGGFGFGGGFHQSYASGQDDYYAERRYEERRRIAQARARAKAQAQAQAQAVAAQQNAAAKVKVAAADTTVAKKGDLETSVTTIAKTDDDTATASSPRVCRKYLAATGGMVETACE